MRTSGPSQPFHLLLDVLDTITGLQIPHAVVGALAVSYYGVPRATADADAILWLKGPTDDLHKRLTHSGYKTELKRGDFDDPISRILIIRDDYENRLDLLIGVRGMSPDAPSRCITESLMGSTIRIIGAEDLIAMKLFAGGVQDINDVRGILDVSRERLNLNLLREIVAQYGTEATAKLNAHI